MSDWGDWELHRLGNELGSVELTPEDEAMFDAQVDEQERDDWLAAWSDDFNSDGYLAATQADIEADIEAVKADRRPHWNDTIAAIQATLNTLKIETGPKK